VLASEPTVEEMCAGTLGLDPEVQQFVDVQCEVNATVFGDGVEPSAAYAVEGWNATTGTYTVFGASGQIAEFETVYVLAGNVAVDAPDLFALGVDVAFAMGVLTGPEGSIAVSGTVLTTGALTLDEEPVLLINEVLEEPELAVFATAARLESGIRVTDLETLETTTLIGAPIGDSMVLLGSPTDPSTVYAVGLDGGGAAPGSIGSGDSTAQQECIGQAYARYQIAVDAAVATYKACMTAALKTALECAIGCGLLSLFIPLLPAIIGCGLCIAYYATTANQCGDNLSIAMDAAGKTLALDLRACGVLLVHD